MKKLVLKNLLVVFSLIVALGNVAHSAPEEAPKMTVQEFFDKFSLSNIDLVDQFYAKDALFEDPIGTHKGSVQIKKYYANLYKNVNAIRFEYLETIVQGEKHVLVWKMYLKAKGIKGGEEVVTHGNSVVHFKNGMVVYHRDYFDMGEFIYEHIPVLGSTVKFVKKKLKSE
jgi:ketosteroid isomerase-like protein